MSARGRVGDELGGVGLRGERHDPSRFLDRSAVRVGHAVHGHASRPDVGTRSPAVASAPADEPLRALSAPGEGAVESEPGSGLLSRTTEIALAAVIPFLTPPIATRDD